MSNTVPTTESLIQMMKDFYGADDRATEWIEVTQGLINRFADATLDPDWMHIDPERARREGPFDGTIAFGFWTMSMLTHFNRLLLGDDYPEGVGYGFNYGFDKVRLMNPVPVGCRIRDHIRLVSCEERGNGRVLVRTSHRIEVQGEEQPAMVAEWLFMVVTAGSE